MRIVGTHSSGSRIEIIKNELGHLELYCYSSNGELFNDSIHKNVEIAKSHARKQFNIQGQWNWNVIIDLKAQESEIEINIDFINRDSYKKKLFTNKLNNYKPDKPNLVNKILVKQVEVKQVEDKRNLTKKYLSKVEAIVAIDIGQLVKSDTSDGYVTFRKKPYGFYEIQVYKYGVDEPVTYNGKFTSLKISMNTFDKYYIEE